MARNKNIDIEKKIKKQMKQCIYSLYTKTVFEMRSLKDMNLKLSESINFDKCSGLSNEIRNFETT